MENTVTGFTPRASETIYRHRKESSFRRQLSLVDLDTGREVATVRFYGNGSRHYCCAWFNGLYEYGHDTARGSDYAGGYGYHKDSAAMHGALTNAGWSFERGFGGVGETGERTALEAIADYLGIARPAIFTAHP